MGLSPSPRTTLVHGLLGTIDRSVSDCRCSTDSTQAPGFSHGVSGRPRTSLVTSSIQNAVDRLIESRSAVRAHPLLSADGKFSVEHAYAIQDALRAELVRQGQRPIGWKLAATGPTGQALFGIEEPIYGFLLSETYDSGNEVSAAAFVNLHAEAEIAFKLGADLPGPGVTAATALEAVESAMPALELPDMFFDDTPDVTDAIANGALAKAIVLGSEFSPLGESDLKQEKVTLEHNGQVVSVNAGSELMGDPLNALAWLANHLSARGHTLMRGDIVMSGGISKLLSLNVGDVVTAKFTRLGSVTLKVA